MYLAVGYLLEIQVPLTHGMKRLGCGETYTIVGLIFQLAAGLSGPDWDDSDYGGRMQALHVADWASILDPVANPSSTRITVRLFRLGAGAPPR